MDLYSSNLPPHSSENVLWVRAITKKGRLHIRGVVPNDMLALQAQLSRGSVSFDVIVPGNHGQSPRPRTTLKLEDLEKFEVLGVVNVPK